METKIETFGLVFSLSLVFVCSVVIILGFIESILK